MVQRSNIVSGRVQLKWDGIRWRTGEEVKGKLANWVCSQYPSHYLGTRCIQHYYRWCTHLDCEQSTELKSPGRFKWTRPFRRKTKSVFCACAITFQLVFTACLLRIKRAGCGTDHSPPLNTLPIRHGTGNLYLQHCKIIQIINLLRKARLHSLRQQMTTTVIKDSVTSFEAQNNIG